MSASGEGTYLVQCILESPEWARAREWGEARPGHPEGKIGRHVLEQILPFIDLHYGGLADYWNLVALAYLHDIGKPLTRYERGHLVGDSHSTISARISRDLAASDRLIEVIQSNDRPYSYWRSLFDRRGDFMPERFTADRRNRFVQEFSRQGLDVCLLILFHRADNAYRRPQQLDQAVDPVLWFEKTLSAEGIVGIGKLPQQGENKRRLWLPTNQIRGVHDVEFFPPWEPCTGLEKQLEKEIRRGHVLHGVEARAVAKRGDCDDVLFDLPEHEFPVAQVHLTWGAAIAPDFPATRLYKSWSDWVENCLYPDAEEFRTASIHYRRLP